MFLISPRLPSHKSLAKVLNPQIKRTQREKEGRKDYIPSKRKGHVANLVLFQKKKIKISIPLSTVKFCILVQVRLGLLNSAKLALHHKNHRRF